MITISSSLTENYQNHIRLSFETNPELFFI